MVYVPGYNGKAGCIPPLSDVNAIRNAIEEESFSDDKIIVAKQALKGKCMSVQNIITYLNLLTLKMENWNLLSSPTIVRMMLIIFIK